MNYTIRKATPADGEIISHYNSLMAQETEGKTLNPGVIGAGVEAVLQDAGKGRYWIAEAAGEVVGQIMVTHEWSDWRNGTLWWIQSVYVQRRQRRNGVFSALYRHVESLARATDDVRGLRLYVEQSNRKAQKAYTALGMMNPGYQVMETIFGD